MADHMLAAVGAMLVAQAATPSIMGRWLIGDGVSVVEIAPCGDAACGSLVGDRGARDRANTKPTFRNRKICRLELLAGLRRVQPSRWEGGYLYDPESGATYVVSAHVDANRLRLRISVPEDGSTFDLKWKRVIARVSASAASEVLEIRAELERALHRLPIFTGRQPLALQHLAMNGGSTVRYSGTSQVAFPASALAVRPDVYAAEREIAAAMAEIGVATAELYPHIVLLGNGGVLSTSTGDLLSADSVFASLGPRVELHLFSGGRITAQIAAAGTNARQAEARFDHTVLAALQKGSDAIATWRYAQDRFAAFERARVAADRAAKVIAARYEEGTDDLFSLLDARRTAFAPVESAGIAEAEAGLALVSLFKASAGAPIDAESQGDSVDGEAS